MIFKRYKGLASSLVPYTLKNKTADIVYKRFLQEDYADELGFYTKTKIGKDIVEHLVLSLPVGETRTKEEWVDYYVKLTNLLGNEYKKFPALVVKHTDEDHEHIHALVSKFSIQFEPFKLDMHPLKVIEEISKYSNTESFNYKDKYKKKDMVQIL